MVSSRSTSKERLSQAVCDGIANIASVVRTLRIYPGTKFKFNFELVSNSNKMTSNIDGVE